MNPATPGTILILVAAVLLAVATASVPVNKSIYFLSLTAGRRTVTLGCLGYCVGDQCSGTTVGYKLSDAGSLFGINGNIPYANQLSSSVLHGLSYTLVLHPVACGLCALAFLLGILQHCVGCIGAFLTSMVAGFATTVTLVALALDFALFTIAKKRVESDGGTASYGTAIWLTLAAFIVLIVAQMAVCCSCCCPGGGGGGRGGGRKKNRDKDDYEAPHSDPYGERMRMDALQAENDRLRRKANGGAGQGQNQLPRFAEYVTEHEVPLKHDYDDSSQAHHAIGQAYGGGDQYGRGGGGRSTVAAGAGAAAAGAAATHYVPGVGPVYGHGNSATPQHRDSTYNEVGGFGAHGAGLDQEQQQHDYYDPHGQQQQGYGHNPQQHDYYDQGAQQQQHDYYAPQHQQQAGSYYDDGSSSYPHQNVSSPPSTLAMPVPQRGAAPALGAAAAGGAAAGGLLASRSGTVDDSASQYTTSQEQRDRDERRRPTTDDGFGLSALNASAAAPRDEKAELRAAEEAREREAAAQRAGGQGGSDGGHWQEPSAMYYDAEEAAAEPSNTQAYGGGSGSQAGGSHQQHDYYSNPNQQHLSHDAPSYELAIGAISPEEEAARRRSAATGSTSQSRSTSAQGSRSRPPLPAVPPSGSQPSGTGSYYPREKY